jgi:hypothetical protein
MAKFSDIYRAATEHLKVDGRTREGRRLKTQANSAKVIINSIAWHPVAPLPDGIWHIDGREVSELDALRGDIDAFYVIKRNA